MRWQHKEKVRGKATDQLHLGIASSDKGIETQFSIRYTWFDKIDRAARAAVKCR
jgi:hypothetical protein